MQPEVSVVILAAGLGTRMKSSLAKVLHRAGGAPLIEHAVRAARAIAPPERIVVVTGHQAEQVQAAVMHHGVRFQLQAEQKGTGHALQACAGQPGLGSGLLVVLYGDCPLLQPSTLEQLIRRHLEAGAAATVLTARLADPRGYGRILRDGEGRIAAIVEEKDAAPEQRAIDEINSGIYCFDAAALWPRLQRLAPSPVTGELYLTDVISLLRQDGLGAVPLLAGDPAEILGINTRAELAEADRILRARKARELMLAGATIERPETVLIDPDVEAAPDTHIGPFAQLLGRTRLAAGARVGACSILMNAEIGENAEVLPFCHIEDSRLEAGARVGPYARLRMRSTVAAGAHVGNFVEMKNSTLGEGAKAMHLAYLGDSTIGARANIGAGTITCNYDGFRKHPTTIGSGAFIGSNATLVAPVVIGDGAFVAAASIVTKDVPADALAIGRAHQINRDGWARARREKAQREGG
ncbi:MAG: bifunctional UDP-N-acetylglucosamine diphosphorylase/glucosamine-1-phosphate N-acetyltransferase GlmU [Bryobacteraceae bacterium]|nr:bifunctional UDP-N-acetylglucosamine diphosphorylase/glucosamine-1-phosphate N-acetyltransferase GlmU [Bryobacteraceae bacterium]